MEFRLLGALEVAHDDDVVRIGSALQRRLLAVLLVHARTVVSADRLVDVLWGEQPPVDARQGLWTNVARLRRALPVRQDGDGDGSLLTRSPGYLLDVEPEQVDAGRFEALAAAASQPRGRSAAPRRARSWTRRSGLWRGPALPGVRGGAVRRHRGGAAGGATAGGDRRALRDRPRRSETTHELVGRLRAYTRDHPFRERPRAQLMLALYRCGRQAEALEAYRGLPGAARPRARCRAVAEAA